MVLEYSFVIVVFSVVYSTASFAGGQFVIGGLILVFFKV